MLCISEVRASCFCVDRKNHICGTEILSDSETLMFMKKRRLFTRNNSIIPEEIQEDEDGYVGTERFKNRIRPI